MHQNCFHKNKAVSRFWHISMSCVNVFELFDATQKDVCLVRSVRACGMLFVWFMMGTTYLRLHLSSARVNSAPQASFQRRSWETWQGVDSPVVGFTSQTFAGGWNDFHGDHESQPLSLLKLPGQSFSQPFCCLFSLYSTFSALFCVFLVLFTLTTFLKYYCFSAKQVRCDWKIKMAPLSSLWLPG